MDISERGFDPLHDLPYDLEDWALVENGIDLALRDRSESLFSLGNGFIGVRGGFEESLDDEGLGAASVYLNGVYETMPIHYHEMAHGFAQSSDTRPPAANATGFSVYADGVALSLASASVLSSMRKLDFKRGILERHIRWKLVSGAVISLCYERLVSMKRASIFAQKLSVTMEQGSADIAIHTHIEAVHKAGASQSVDAAPASDAPHDPRLGPAFAQTPWQLEKVLKNGTAFGYAHRLKKSGIPVAVAVDHHVLKGDFSLSEVSETDTGLTRRFQAKAGPDAPLSLVKFVSYHSDTTAHSQNSPDDAALYDLAQARDAGFDRLCAEQRADLAQFWEGADLEIEGAPVDSAAVRFNIFQVLQAAGRGGKTSICAKGQTGEGYEGHYFWDAEIFGLPLLGHSRPERARDMLVYRHRSLEDSRRHAREMGHERGALIAWRTISGRECSAYFPAGSAQYHINADVAFAIEHYMALTGDSAFLHDHGAEILFETARIWPQIGFFNPRKDGAFCIHCVTGPDEYTALVNNNFYTNAMARQHLDYAYQVAHALMADAPDVFARIANAIGLHEDEITEWRRAADAMYLPYDEALGIHPQDDSFLDKKRWDISGTPKDKFPLLLHYHPLTIYRHQVCKQADTVLAMVLLGDQFAPADKARDLRYYEDVTVHDSTLSACVFGMLASQVGRLEQAHEYFRHAAFVDLGDLHKNTGHGLHMASLGGSWMCLVNGFAGLRFVEGRPVFSPVLPDQWQGLSFRIRVRGRIILVRIGKNRCRYRLISGAPLTIQHHDQPLELKPDETIEAATLGKEPA